MSQIQYSLKVEQDHAPVRGNAMVSGDAAADKACEDDILRRLNQGDVWAWAAVLVIAEYAGFKGTASLGCCSYKDEAEFKADAYYKDLCKEARSDLIDSMEKMRERVYKLPIDLKRIK